MIAIALMMLGCAAGRASDAERHWCATNRVHYHTKAQWDEMDRAEQDEEVSHNEYGLSICGKAWAKLKKK